MITYNRQASQPGLSKVHHNRRTEEQDSFSRSSLQLVSLLGVIFLLSRATFSLFGEYFGTQMLIPSYKTYGYEIDQNTRILGGMWFFVSFCILWCLPKIEEQNRATLYRSCMGILWRPWTGDFGSHYWSLLPIGRRINAGVGAGGSAYFSVVAVVRGVPKTARDVAGQL